MKSKQLAQWIGPVFQVFLALLSAGLPAGCGGNYSNEDIDFQNAVPAPEEISPKLNALSRSDSAELFVSTQKTLRDVTSLLDMILGAIDQVRHYPATSRAEGVRVWGPFDSEDNPNQRIRIEIRKAATVVTPDNPLDFEFAYKVEVARKDVGAWVTFVTGRFAPQGGVRRGKGNMSLSLANLRAAGIPIKKDDGIIETFTVSYETLDVVKWNALLTALVRPAPDAPIGTPLGRAEGTFAYVEAPAANQASFSFEWRGGNDPNLRAAQVSSTWRLSDSAGRADFAVTEGLATGLRGADCWGPDTVATYVHRDWDASLERGAAASCVFPAP